MAQSFSLISLTHSYHCYSVFAVQNKVKMAHALDFCNNFLKSFLFTFHILQMHLIKVKVVSRDTKEIKKTVSVTLLLDLCAE